MTASNTGKVKLSDGFFRQNAVMMSGLFAGPVIGAATTVENALAICMMFTFVTVISVALCRLLPKKIAFAVRIVLYALISSLVYIPVTLLAGLLFPQSLLQSIELYLVIIVINPFILSKTESRFFLRSVPMMFKDLAGFVLGFDAACILVGAIRDILTDKIILNTIVYLPIEIPASGRVFGGFILVGMLAGLIRAIYNRHIKKKKKGYVNQH